MSVIKPALQHPARITYLTGASNYTWLHFRNGEKTMLAKSINYFESLLSHFVRVHKTALINPAYVESLEEPPRRRMTGQVRLAGDIVLPVSRRRWNEVTAQLQPYLIGKPVTPVMPLEEHTPLADSDSMTVNESFIVVLATDDATAARQPRQAVDSVGSKYQYVLHIVARSHHLPAVFRLLSGPERPVLVLLDARSAISERLHTLQDLKENSASSCIPVILLVSPTSNLVADAYARRANSVVTVPTDCTKFVTVMSQLCRTWQKGPELPLA